MKKGRPQTKETREKISQNNSRYWLGKKRPPLSPEHKAKLLGSLKGNQHTKGMKFPNKKKSPPKSEETKNKYKRFHGETGLHWKGGCLNFHKKETLKRDDWTCQICGLRDPDVMEVDHRLCRSIHPELYNDPTNLWTLCANCHRRKTRKEDWVKITEHHKKQSNG